MDTAYWVLLILFLVYLPIYIWVWKNPEKAARWHLQKYGPAMLIKSRIGIRTMDRLAKYKRFWHLVGFIEKVLSAILLLMMVYMMVVAVLAIPSRIGQGSIGIEYALAIPGFNPIMPLTYGIVALFFAMVVHELGHGIQARANDAKVDSTGLLYLAIPLGAFCEPNEQEMSQKPRKAQMDMYAAGITMNTFWAVVAIAIMVAMCSCVATPYNDEAGVYTVDNDSPFFDSGIPASAIITGVKEFGADYDYLPVVSVTNDRGTSFTVKDGSLDLLPTGFYSLRYDYRGSTYYTSDERGYQIGCFIKTVTLNSPAYVSGIQVGTFLSSITVDGVTAYISNPVEFTEYMSTTHPGDLATVETVTRSLDGVTYITESHTLTFSDSNGVGFIGISTNTSGAAMTTPGILMDSAVNPFYNANDPYSYLTGLFSYLSGPFNGMDPISDEVRWWYDAPGGDVFWVVVKTLYWIFWLDLLLAISNALPAYPFDGGFIFEGGINWFLERIGIKDEEQRRKKTEGLTNTISTLMLFMLAAVFMSFLL